MATYEDFRNDVKPNWCPGCGHFMVMGAMQRAAAGLGLEPHELAVVSGIGCSGRVSGYIKSYGFHSTHGRALPVAQGVKMGNRDLSVIAVGGDGDGYAIGMGHTIHAMRRNMDITYIVMDNHVYSLTKGQTSPRSEFGFKTKSTPEGSVEIPVSPLELALSAGATYVAQGFSGNQKELTDLIKRGMEHKGFAFINVFSPCVTYNKINTYQWFKKNIISLSTLEDYDPVDRIKAMHTIMEHQGIVTGLVYQDKSRASYQDLAHGYSKTSLVNSDLRISEGKFKELVAEFM